MNFKTTWTALFLALPNISWAGPKLKAELQPIDFNEQVQFYTKQNYRPESPSSLQLVCYIKSGNGQDYVPCGELSWSGQKWHLQVRIGVFGVTSTRGVSNETIRQIQEWQSELNQQHQLKKEYIDQGRRAESWQGVPEVARMISTQIKGISKILSNESVETQIAVFFVNEKNLVSDKVWASETSISPEVDQKLRDPQVQKKLFGKSFLPLQYVATPQRDYIVPGSADPFAWPEFMAHEVFHFISIDQKNDGFLYGNYPLNGVMNSWIQFQALRKHGVLPRLLAIEFNTLILNQLAYRDAVTASRSSGNVLEHFRKLSDAYALRKEFLPNYYSEGGLGRTPIEESRALLSHYKIQASYPTKSDVARLSDDQFLEYWVDLQEKNFFSAKK